MFLAVVQESRDGSEVELLEDAIVVYCSSLHNLSISSVKWNMSTVLEHTACIGQTDVRLLNSEGENWDGGLMLELVPR
jgi:hypothetical protein